MKKITKTNFQGLRQLFPVLEKEEMRHYVGGTFGGYYYTGGWNSDGGYYGSPGSGDSSYYSQYDFNNWEGPWYGGWVEGMGWVAPDADIYGHKPGGGSSNTHEYPYWWYYDEPFEHPDWDGNYGGYYYNGSFDDGNLNLIHLNNGECVVAAIVNAGIMLGVDLSVSSITSDLKSYKDNSINRYVISDELLGNILDDYLM
ncbi:TIGR04149 family rSAM-modified RiPP [Bacteroides faecis]|nr:TIGR04149 family rSAM-modified RiPP [Bacteroides faecis]